MEGLGEGGGSGPPADPAPAQVKQEKRALRERALSSRAALAADRDAAARVCDNLLAAVPLAPGQVVAGYWPVGHELDCRTVLEALHRLGHPCCLPVVAARRAPLSFRAWAPGMALAPGCFGERVPPPGCPELPPDVLLVPLLQFDSTGHRLGYGAGYYDRTLRALRTHRLVTAVGVAYEGQACSRVPCEPTDEPLDWIVTEVRALGCRATPDVA